jgi:hypothetical protein
MQCNELAYPIKILSVRGIILVTHIRKQQVLKICGNEDYVDLYVIPMIDITVILGMDWLSNHGAQIDCGENTMAIREPGGQKAIYQVELQLNSLKEVRIEDIPIVRVFQDAFPKKLPRMPPDREIEFTIDLIPGTSPIAQAPYKMGLKELEELKTQIDELEQKDS